MKVRITLIAALLVAGFFCARDLVLLCEDGVAAWAPYVSAPRYAPAPMFR